MAREQEFERLQQGLDMTIDEYSSKFVRLSPYTPHLVLDERRRIRRFILELRQPLFDVIAPHVNVYPSYATAAEAARTVEYGRKTKGGNSKKREVTSMEEHLATG